MAVAAMDFVARTVDLQFRQKKLSASKKSFRVH